MSNCPQCNADLSRLTWPITQCPACGRSIAPDSALSNAAASGESPVGDLNATANFVATNATVDFALATPSAPSSEPAADVGEATVDFPAPQKSTSQLEADSAAPKSKTEHFIPPTVNMPLAGTIQFSSPPASLVPAAGGATMDFPPPSPQNVPPSDATIDLGPLQSRKTDPLAFGMATFAAGDSQVRGLGTQMDRVWRESIGSSDRPDMTYKAGGSASQTVINVVIRPRRLESSNLTTVGTADYELVEVLGEGGVGIVFAARQASIDRSVAVKMLKANMASDAGHRAKFLSEAVVTGDLDHPNIVPIYDLGSNDSGALFYSMKRVRGTPWSKVIGQKTQTENLEILMKVADAVAFAHARGVLHRDLKPENVMLGDYGEVLVMDWGIALSTPEYPKHGAITQTASMGGTPVYMAPEMATGPLEAITAASDVYLLGAILFEMLVGKPPHTGKDVMSCIYAAMRNEIRPTTKTGELLDIAYKAMATNAAERYPSILAFQAAVRDYQSHSESIALSTRAEGELAAAKQSREYRDFARVLFAFQEAAALWDGNHRAQTGVNESRLAYAGCALEKGDFELGISLLDKADPTHAELLSQLAAAQQERDARQQRLKRLRRIAVALVLLVFSVVTIAFFWIQEKNRQVVTAYDQLTVTNRDLTNTTNQLKVSEGNLRDEKLALEENQKRLREEKLRADASAAEAKLEAQRAREAQQREAHATYLAQIGLSAERIANNSFVDANHLLSRYAQGEEARFRHWEWGHLRHLCQLDRATLSTGAYVESVARSADGSLVVAGTSAGTAIVWKFDWSKIVQAQSNVAHQEMTRVNHGAPIHAVAMSANGQLLATAGERPSGDQEAEIKLWQRAGDGKSFQLLRIVPGHRDGVLSVAFSADAKQLASSSRDETARLWDVATGAQIKALRGHFGPVWSVAFGPAISPRPAMLVTAGDDATVRVWTVASETPPQIFRGHKQAVYAANFDPTGRFVASGGRDNDVLVWEWSNLADFDFQAVEARLKASSDDKSSGNLVANVAPFRHEPAYRLVGHSAEIRSVVFSSDGNLLLTSGNDNCVKQWRYKSPATDVNFVQTFRGHGGWVRSSIFAPQARFCISGGRDSQLKIWDSASYEEVRTLRGHEDAVLASAFSPSGKQVVTAGRDRRAIIWNAETGEPLKQLDENPDSQKAAPAAPQDNAADRRFQVATLKEGHEFLVTSAAFFPRGDRLVTSAGDSTARLWDVATGGELRRFDGTGNVGAVAVASNGKWLATGSVGNEALVWRADDSQVPAVRLSGHESAITAIAFSLVTANEDPTLFTGDALGRGRLWRRDPKSGAWTSYAKCSGHLAGFGITAARFLPGKQQLLTASHDHAVFRWDVKTGERVDDKVLKHPDAVKSLDVSADGRSAVTLCSLGKNTYRMFVWDLEKGAERHIDPNVRGGIVTLVTFHHDQQSALVTSTNGAESSLWRWTFASNDFQPLWPANTVRGTVWSALCSPTGEHILAVGGSQARLLKAKNGDLEKSFRPHSAITAAAYSLDGKFLATGGTDGDVKLWDAAETDLNFGKVKFKIPHAHEKDGVVYGITSVTFGPTVVAGSHLLLTTGDDGTARLWDVSPAAAAARTVFTGHQGRVRAAAFSPDGKLVVTASEDRTARLWDATTGQPVGDRGGQLLHAASVATANFSADGQWLITGSDDNLTRLWNIAELAAIPAQPTTLAGHTAPVTAVSFSPDGRRAITASQDGTAKIWDTSTGTEVLSLKRHTAEITSARLSPNGRNILTSSRDGTAILWPTTAFGP